MKKINLFLGLCAAAVLSGCASEAKSGKAPVPQTLQFNFSTEVVGKVWLLETIITSEGSIDIDHGSKMNADAFNIMFDALGTSSGKGWPNRYRAPYRQTGVTLAIDAPAATQMMAIGDPPGIQERDFFRLLLSVKAWELDGGNLVLLGGEGERLIFVEFPNLVDE
jgi:heat shock protein HslJ